MASPYRDDDTIATMQRMNAHDFPVVQHERRGVPARVKNWCGNRRRVCAWIAAVGMVTLIITLSVAVPKGKQSGSDPSAVGPRIPKPEVKPPVEQVNKNELGDFLFGAYDKLGLSYSALSEEGTPQFLALQWIAGRAEFTAYVGAQRVQRFALACFYYSTFLKAHDYLDSPTDWKSQTGWITDVDECTWEGIACDSHGQVMGIILQEHYLSGSIPLELALLPQLQELDLTSNFIYMENDLHAVWQYLSGLKMLMMEDNFFVTADGLPSQFSFLVNLEKVQLSYNLLEGVMTDAVFQGMQKLQHFEVESNYLSGDIPSAVGQLSNLVYMYARRNALSISLSNMIVAGAYPTLFSLWLDNNVVSGSMPTEIGNVTSLASFSITNSSVTGTLPTELGLLTDLRRVWLYGNELSGKVPTQLSSLVNLEVFEIYDNKLTGSMPATICASVAASSYEFKALTADCQAVACDTCCTECH